MRSKATTSTPITARTGATPIRGLPARRKAAGAIRTSSTTDVVNQNLGGGTLGGYNTPITGTTCTFDVQKTQEFTIGFWQDAYKGNLGRVRYGLQYEYVRLTAFQGLPGVATGNSTPNQGLTPNNNILMFSFRYYPFN